MTIYRNITEDGEEKTYERLFCCQELTAGIHGNLIFLSAFKVLLAIRRFIFGKYSDPNCLAQRDVSS